MLATSLALLLSLMTSALFAVSLKRVRRLLKVATVWRVIISLTWAVQLLAFTSLASTLAMLVVGRGGPRTSVKDRRCDRVAKAIVVVGFAWALAYKAIVWLKIYYLSTHQIHCHLNRTLLKWACAVGSALMLGHLVVALHGHYVTGLVSRDGECARRDAVYLFSGMYTGLVVKFVIF